jgi:hypothetical protein
MRIAHLIIHIFFILAALAFVGLPFALVGCTVTTPEGFRWEVSAEEVASAIVAMRGGKPVRSVQP